MKVDGVGEVLVYVSRVDLAGPSGQASFERGIIEAFLRYADSNPARPVQVVTVASQPLSGVFDDPRVLTIRLLPHSAIGYLAHQGRLLLKLLRLLYAARRRRVILVVRFSPTMIVPVLVAYLTRCTFIYRTGPVVPSVKAYRGENRAWVLRSVLLLSWLYARRAHRIVVATHAIGDWVKEAHPAHAHKVVVVPNGARVEAFCGATPDRTAWGLPCDELVVGYVGSLIPEQGVDTVIKAMALIEPSRRPHLFVAGDGPKRAEYGRLAEEIGVASRITWTGAIPHNMVGSAVASCDVMVLPVTAKSLAARGTSATKLFEYLACDRWVLASRCGDLAFLGENRLGALLEPDDPTAWCAGLEAARLAPKNLGGRGRALVQDEYSYQSVASKVWALASCR